MGDERAGPPGALALSPAPPLAAEALAVEWAAGPPAGWEEWLPRASGASFAARSGWLAALAALRPAPRVSLLCARREGRLVGAVPVALATRFGLAWARSLPFGTYGGPLVSADDPDPAAVRAALARAFDEWLDRERVAGGEVTHAPLEPDARPDARWEALATAVTPGSAHVVDLAAGAAAILAGLKRETRKGLRHAERAGVEVAERPEALAEVYRLYRGQERERGARGSYSLEFLRALVGHPSRCARLFVATCRGRIEAGILALSGGGETFLWWSGAAAASRQSLSFPYLIVAVLERAAAAGERRLNLGSSGGRERLHRFKESLGAVPRPLFVYHLRPRRADWRLGLHAALRTLRRRQG